MAWQNDRPTRLEALLAKARAQAKYLRNEMFVAPRGSEARDAIARRLDLVERRVRRLSGLARWARRSAKELAAY